MSENLVTEPLTFSSWFYNHKAIEIKDLREKLIPELKLQKDSTGFCSVLYNYLRGLTPVRPIAQERQEEMPNQKYNFPLRDNKTEQ